jgi:BON domain-containing protein
MKNLKVGAIRILLLGTLLACLPALALGEAKPQQEINNSTATQTNLEKKVRHNLVMLPYYGVFDHLEFRVDGDRVILSGAVTRPTLKDDAQNVLKPIEGVNHVTNNIKVLPLSRFDNEIRLREYRAIFSQAPLSRYSMGVVPSIHIIVDNGHVTLEGVVDNKVDASLANIAANTVPGVFSVTNNLRVGS